MSFLHQLAKNLFAYFLLLIEREESSRCTSETSINTSSETRRCDQEAQPRGIKGAHLLLCSFLFCFSALLLFCFSSAFLCSSPSILLPSLLLCLRCSYSSCLFSPTSLLSATLPLLFFSFPSILFSSSLRYSYSSRLFSNSLLLSVLLSSLEKVWALEWAVMWQSKTLRRRLPQLSV